jgi:glutamate dehydrogenase (NADP+)
MFGQYKRMRGEHSGVLTGKGWGWGGSLIRPEATGFGCVYALKNCVDEQGTSLQGNLTQFFWTYIFFKK